MRQNTINCTHHLSNLQIVFTFLTWRTFSMCHSVMWRISSSNNMSCAEISPHGRFFLHGHRPWCPWQISSMDGNQNDHDDGWKWLQYVAKGGAFALCSSSAASVLAGCPGNLLHPSSSLLSYHCHHHHHCHHNHGDTRAVWLGGWFFCLEGVSL